MSFSWMIRHQCKADPEQGERWEKAFLELQVLLACCDGSVSPSERMTLSLMSLACRNEKDNRELVDSLLATVDKKGFDHVARRVATDLRKLLDALPESQRPSIARDVLRESMAIVVADDVVAPKERSFLLGTVAPALRMDEVDAAQLVDQATLRLARTRLFVAIAFELYLMVVDAVPGEPSLHAPPGRELPPFLSAVDALVTREKLGSSRAVSYFLSALGGLFWVHDHATQCAGLERMAVEARQRLARTTVDARLGEIHAELDAIASEAPAPDPFLAASQHLTAALTKLDGLHRKQRAMFRDRIAPALNVDHDGLLDSASRRKSLVDLHRNLSDTIAPQPVDFPVAEDQKRWWKLWQ